MTYGYCVYHKIECDYSGGSCRDCPHNTEEDTKWFKQDEERAESEEGMIQINDFDSPIQVAEKIISGTKAVPTSMLDKAVYRVFTGKEIGETVNRDMFELEEIKEIAEYLMVYYNTHQNGD